MCNCTSNNLPPHSPIHSVALWPSWNSAAPSVSLCPLFSATLIGAFGIGHCDVRKPPIGPIAPMYTCVRVCFLAHPPAGRGEGDGGLWCIGWPHRPANSAAALLGRNYDANRSPLPPIRLHCRIVCWVGFISLPNKCFLLECIMQCVFFCCSVAPRVELESAAQDGLVRNKVANYMGSHFIAVSLSGRSCNEHISFPFLVKCQTIV